MNFYQAFDSVKEGIKDFNSTQFNSGFAIQITMTDEDCGGIFYIEYKDGTLHVEPYNYYDHNVNVTVAYADLCKAMTSVSALNTALSDGKITLTGVGELFKSFVSAISFKTGRKAPQKKVEKKTVKKAAKEPAEKATGKTTKSAAAPKQKAVSEKAVAPEKKDSVKKASDTPKTTAKKKQEKNK